MAHQLYRVIALAPGGFAAFPIVDGGAVLPNFNTDTVSTVELGEFLENCLERAWIDKGHTLLKASLDAQVAEYGRMIAEAEAAKLEAEKEEAAKQRKANDEALAASRMAKAGPSPYTDPAPPKPAPKRKKT